MTLSILYFDAMRAREKDDSLHLQVSWKVIIEQPQIYLAFCFTSTCL